MPLDLLPISRSAPQGAHTAKSNSVRPPAAHRDRKRRGGRAGGLGAKTGDCAAVRTAAQPGSDSRYTIDRSRKRRGGRTEGSGDASSHPPALPYAGRGRGVTNPLRRGTAAAGRGFLPSYRRLLLGRPLPQRPSDALGIQGGVSCFPYPPLTHRRRRGWWTGRREGCGVWGGLSGPGPAVRAAREAAGGARPPGGYPGGSSSGPRPLHA